MSEGGVTLGQFLIAVAAVELAVLPLMVRSARRSNPDATPEQHRTGAIFIVGAGIATAIGLCLVGLYWPDAQMRLY